VLFWLCSEAYGHMSYLSPSSMGPALYPVYALSTVYLSWGWFARAAQEIWGFLRFRLWLVCEARRPRYCRGHPCDPYARLCTGRQSGWFGWLSPLGFALSGGPRKIPSAIELIRGEGITTRIIRELFWAFQPLA
jgi:hypothetical protein